MGKKSKKTRTLAQKEKARNFHAQFQPLRERKEALTALKDNELLDARVALNPAIAEKLDNSEHFILIFDDYNDDECQIIKLDSSQSRSLIRKFKEITSCNQAMLSSSKIIYDSIFNDGGYRGLFRKLSPDIELKESKLSGEARLFFHIVERFFCIVAVKAKHISIDK